MKILALDSSSLVASVAVVEDELLTAEDTINYKKTHSQTLLPMIDAVAKMTELDLDTVDAIAITKGPGSFTGLRIGSATAKGLCLALGKPVIPVETMAAMAYNLWGSSAIIVPIMDARRDQVYAGVYQFQNNELITHREQCAEGIEELLSDLNQSFQDKEIIFLGDGVPAFRDKIEEQLILSYTFAPAHMNRQRAGSVGVLAEQYYRRRVVESAAEHRPDYLRLSQAERERRERQEAAKLSEQDEK